MQNKLKKMPIAIIEFLFILIIIWIIEIKNNFLPYVDQWTRSIVNRTHGTVVYDIFRWITESWAPHMF